VTKAPVAILSLDPDVQCTNQAVNYDITGSYAPLGTLDRYTISWGDGHLDDVALPGAMTGSHTYAAAGTYDVELRVHEQLCTWGNVTVQVRIVDCDDSLLIEYMYALSQSAGPFVRDMDDAAPAWEQRIRGLAGHPDWLVGRDLKLDPHRKHLPDGSRHVWIATRRGPAKSAYDTLFWQTLRDALPAPRNDAGDTPAPTVDMLDFYCLSFNPMARDEVYLLAGTAGRAWVYWTLDGGATWDNWQVSTATSTLSPNNRESGAGTAWGRGRWSSMEGDRVGIGRPTARSTAPARRAGIRCTAPWTA
jgi:hypothetical protein